MGTFFSPGKLRIRRVAANPSIKGKLRSIRIILGFSRAAASTASWPLVASTTLKPLMTSSRPIICRLSSVSSTKRTVATRSLLCTGMCPFSSVESAVTFTIFLPYKIWNRCITRIRHSFLLRSRTEIRHTECRLFELNWYTLLPPVPLPQDHQKEPGEVACFK